MKYEPETVAVIGKLHRETLPGRPNFESAANRESGNRFLLIIGISYLKCVSHFGAKQTNSEFGCDSGERN